MAFTDVHVRKIYGALRHAYEPFELDHILYHGTRWKFKHHKLISHPLIHYVIERTEADEAIKCELIKILLEHGVGFDERYRRQTGIQHAQRSRYRQVETLLGRYYDLFGACRSGDILSVQNILSSNEVCINACDDKGKTPLHIAAQYGHGELVEFLLRQGAHFDKKNDTGQTPLAVAQHNQSHKPEECRETKRQWQSRFTSLLFLLSDCEDLFNDVETGKEDQVRELLFDETRAEIREESRVKLSIRNQYNNTILHEAVRSAHLPLARFFIQQCQMDIELPGYMGNTPLIVAVRDKNLTGIQSLLALEANVNGVNKFGDTAIFSAVYDGDKQIIQYLVGNGAQPDAIGFRGHNLFYEAISRDDVELIKFLYGLGVDIEIPDNFGKTALLNAAWEGHFIAFKTLIELGADIRKLCHLGRNIMHFFARRAEIDWPEELLNIELIEKQDEEGHVERTVITKEQPACFKCPPRIPGLTYQSVRGGGYRLFESIEFFLEHEGAKEAGKIRQLVCEYLDDHPFELSRGGMPNESEYRRLIHEIREGRGKPNQIQMDAIKNVIQKVLDRQINIIPSNGKTHGLSFAFYNSKPPIFLYQHVNDNFEKHISVDVVEPFDVFFYQDRMSFHEGLKFKSIPGEVNLFDAVAHLVNQDKDKLYEQVLDYLERHKDEFARYYSHKDDMDTHIDYLRTGRSAGSFEIEVLMRLLDRPIAIVNSSGFARIPTEYHYHEPIPEFDLTTDEGYAQFLEYHSMKAKSVDPITKELDKYQHPPIFLYKAGFSVKEHFDIFAVATTFNAAEIYRELSKNSKHLSPKTQEETSHDVIDSLREQQTPSYSEIPLVMTDANPPLERKKSSHLVGDIEYKRILINISDMLLEAAEGKDNRLPMDEAFVREHRDYYIGKDKAFFEQLTISEFFHAIASRNLTYIHTFIERFYEKDLSKVLNKHGQSPLHYLLYLSRNSIFRRSEEDDDPTFKDLFDLFILKHSNLNALDKTGNTLMAYAVRLEGWFADYTISRLQEYNVSLTECNSKKQSAMQIAIEHCASEKIITKLLLNEANDNLLDELLSQSFSKEYMFRRYGIPRLALLFYDAGRRCSEQYYPRMVFYASIFNRLDILESLYKTNITEIYRDDEGFTALHHVSNKQTAAFLVAHGFPLNQQGNSDRQTPLHMFTRSEESDEILDLIRYFISLKGVDINRQDNRGDTALHIVIVHQRYAMFDALLEAHPNLEVRNNDKQTVLMMAGYRKQTHLVGRLCEACANVNVTVDYNMTLLQRILSNIVEYRINVEKNAELVLILLNYHAKYFGSEDALWETALLSQNDELIDCLIGKQTSINEKHLIMALKYPNEIVERLEKYFGQQHPKVVTDLFDSNHEESSSDHEDRSYKRQDSFTM